MEKQRSKAKSSFNSILNANDSAGEWQMASTFVVLLLHLEEDQRGQILNK